MEGKNTPYVSESSSSLSRDDHEAPLRALEVELQGTYSEDPASHQAHAHVEQAVAELEAVQTPTIPGLEGLFDRKEFKGFVSASEQLADSYKNLINIHRKNPLAITQSSEWPMTVKQISSFDETLAELPWSTLPARDVESVIRTVFSMNGYAENFRDESGGVRTEGDPDIQRVLVNGTIPGPQIEEAYWLKPDVVPNGHSGLSFLANLIASKDQIDTRTRTSVLHQAYAQKVALDLVQPGADVAIDTLRGEIGEVQLSIDQLDRLPIHYSPEGIRIHDEQMRHRVERILKVGTRLSDKNIANYQYALLKRSLEKQPGTPPYLAGYKIKNDIQDTINLSKKIVPEVLNYLGELAGVVNFDRYTKKMIEDLSDVIFDNDATRAGKERMARDGVTVVFATAYADYNNALKEVGRSYSDTDETTLLFEISRQSDFYRYLTLLKKHGIRAKTFVFAAHGEPGSIQFSNQNRIFHFVTGEVSEHQKAVSANTNISRFDFERLVSDDFMMNDTFGERRIVVESCSSAVRKEDAESIAEMIVKRANNIDLRVIGSTEEVMRYKDTTRGIRFGSGSDINARNLNSSTVNEAKSAAVELSLRSGNQKLGRHAVVSDEHDVIIRSIEGFEPVRKSKPREEVDA
jgi:hypothetical protein